MNFKAGILLVLIPAGTIFLSTLATSANADDRGSIPIACPNPAIAPVIVSPPNRRNAPIVMLAQKFDAQSPSSATASGHVELRKADQHLSTELLRFLPESKTVQVPGPMIYTDAQLSATAASAGFEIKTGEIEPIPTSNYPTPAERPAYSVLDTGRISALTGMQIPAWRDSLKRMLEELHTCEDCL